MHGMINRKISYKKPAIMVRLYKTLVRPHLERIMNCWSVSSTDFDKGELSEQIERIKSLDPGER